MVNSIFQNVQGLKPRRRAYNMSYRNDFTCNIGTLVPVYMQDLIPNSSIVIRTHGLVRFLPLVAPIMDNIDLYVHFWQAPRRILEGEQFTDMITGETPDDEINLPYWTPKNVAREIRRAIDLPEGSDPNDFYFKIFGDGSLMDLLGYDKTLFGRYVEEDDEWVDESEGKINARKWILYARLLCQWYINENVEPWNGFVDDLESWCNPKNNVHGDISDFIGLMIVNFHIAFGVGFFCHSWQKDYFTSALPSLQYGEPVYLPMGTSAPVTIDSQSLFLSDPMVSSSDGKLFSTSNNALIVESTGDETASLQAEQDDEGSFSNDYISEISGQSSVLTGTADLSHASAVTVNELRLANALQVFKERELKFGRRAPEHYKGYYGVRPRDMRLQIPEYIGGGKMPINISDVEQTSQTTTGAGGSPQGNLAGKGSGVAGGFAGAKCFVPEESLIMGLAFLMPKVTYANLLSRHDTKLNDRFEYYNPSFTHIGEQEVFNYEVYAGSYGTTTGSTEFGYQPRYTEYRFHANEVHGDFKSSLSYWTLGRIFTQQPTLNASFVYMNPLTLNRIFAVVSDSYGFPVRNVLCSLKFSVQLVQPLSRYGTPSLLV